MRVRGGGGGHISGDVRTEWDLKISLALLFTKVTIRSLGLVLAKLELKDLILREESPQLNLQKTNGQFQRNQGSRGVQLFQGGGSNCLFPIETHITCDFRGGGGGGVGGGVGGVGGGGWGGVRTPCPPLWIRTCDSYLEGESLMSDAMYRLVN